MCWLVVEVHSADPALHRGLSGPTLPSARQGNPNITGERHQSD